jgi:hypothetical protein
MEDISQFLIRPEICLLDGRVIRSVAEAAAYVREHEVRPGVDARDEILHRLERAQTKNELTAAAEAFLDWLQGLDLLHAAQASQFSRLPVDTRNVASDPKSAAADYVSSLAGHVRRASYEFDTQIPEAGHFIRKAATQMDKVSEALRTREITDLADELKDFARHRPIAVLGAAVVVGFATVRFFKSAPTLSA